MTRHTHSGYCSWCLKKVTPVEVAKKTITRNEYRCPNCNRTIVTCRALGCTNFACWDKFGDGDKKVSQHDQFCGEHRGVVANFSTLESSLLEPSEYNKIYEKRCTNLAKVSAIGLGMIGGIAIAGPLALIASPCIGGAIGGLMGYSGAAATSAGLAWLGMGSLAAGGFGIAGGMTVVMVGGGAVGSALGAYVGNSYFGDVRNFTIKKIREGKYPAIITVNGLLSEKNHSVLDWESVLPKKYKNQSWFHVDWEAKNLLRLGGYCLRGMGKAALKTALTNAALKATKTAAKKLAPGATVLDIIGLATNPWHVALVKSEKAGVLLADILRRCKDNDFLLFGHSLGARVIYSALRTLSTTDRQIISDVHLFGGAVDSSTSYWKEAKKAVKGIIYNYHSDNDYVLRYMYKAGTFFMSEPIGHYTINDVNDVINVDVTSIVNGHMDYKKNSMRDYIS